MNRIRESSGSPCTPRADVDATLSWNTAATVRPSDTPRGVPDGKGRTDSINSIGSVGNTGTVGNTRAHTGTPGQD